nr:contains similarity to the single-strand binding proteins family (Pfam: SSB.hmm, score: 24.02) [Arabidopsis thaliana]
MFDQRLVGATNQPKPAQWHRIAVHNEVLGSYAVQKLAKNSSVYVEGDIETRVYNDSISSEVKSIPEICVRRDGMYVHIVDPEHQFVAELRFSCFVLGKIRMIKYGESISKISFDELSKLSFFIQLIFAKKKEIVACVLIFVSHLAEEGLI